MGLYLVMEKEERAAWVMFGYKLMPEVRRVYASNVYRHLVR